MDNAGDVILIRQDVGFGAGHPQLRGQGSFKIFVIGRPHKRVVDNGRTLQHGILQIRTIVRHFMGNAVNNHRVFTWLIHIRAAQLHILGHDPLLPLVDLFYKSRWKRPFSPNQ